MTTISFLGTGKMATALITCISKNKQYNIIASSRTKQKLSEIKRISDKIKTVDNNIEAVKDSDIVFICVKPQDMAIVLDEIKDFVDENKIIISIAAGIKISHMKKFFHGKNFSPKIIRLMPNVNCIVGEMACGIASGNNFSGEIKKILEPCGKLFLVDEELMDCVAALGGSCPAFIAYILDLIINAGIKNGLGRKTASEIAMQSFYGTSKLLMEGNIEPKELISMVASPRGATMAGLEILDKSDIRDVIEKTIGSAIKRSGELAENEKT